MKTPMTTIDPKDLAHMMIAPGYPPDDVLTRRSCCCSSLSAYVVYNRLAQGSSRGVIGRRDRRRAVIVMKSRQLFQEVPWKDSRPPRIHPFHRLW